MNDLQFPGLYVGAGGDSAPELRGLCHAGYYAMTLADGAEAQYGRRHYDYCDGTLICRRPGTACQQAPPTGLWTVAFHPEMFTGVSLEKPVEEYTYFEYAPGEALHVSGEERRVLTACVDDMRRELSHGEDCYKRTILTRQLIRLLDHATRFYERQFITRNTANETVVRDYEALVDRYLAAGEWSARGPLTFEHCAERLGLSPAYFEDMLRHELGHTHSCHVQLRRIEIAKRRLCQSDEPVCRIVRELGFPSVQYFSFLFKKITGLSPGEYKRVH